MSQPMYSGWTMPRKEGLFGLTTQMTFSFLALCICSILFVAFGGYKVGGTFTVAWILCAIPLQYRVGGRTLYEISVIKMQFWRAKKRGETIYRSGPFSKIPNGRYRLPGVLATSVMREAISVGGRRFGIIHLPKKDEFTIVFKVWPQGDEAVDQSVINDHVYKWGSYLAYLGAEGDIVGVTAVVETFPATGNKVSNEVEQITDPSSPQLAQQILKEAAQIQSSGRIETEARLAITFKATTAERKRHWEEQASVIAQRLPALAANLAESGLSVREMTPEEIALFVRRAYDPGTFVDLERASFTAEGHGLTWEDCGPCSTEQTPLVYHHDGATSVTWEMSEPPRGSVSDKVLRALLSPNEEVVRKRVAICYRPHSAAEAAKIVDEDYIDALTSMRAARKKDTPSAAAQLRAQAAQQATQEEARGHGVSRFGILITLTEATPDTIPNVEAVLKSLTQQARLRIRRRYGSQQISFAASLGVGVLLPEHVSAAGKMQQ